jgi:hypothetical protein
LFEQEGIEAMKDKQRPRSKERAFRYVYKPNRKVRLANRRGLVEHLIDEIKYGSSISRLYAGMLVKTLLAEEEELRSDYSSLADEAQPSKPSKRELRLGPSIPRLRLDADKRSA